MDKYIFVTGLHRAGTHSFAEHKAKETGLPYIEEFVIKLDNMARVYDFLVRCPNGFVCHCPKLAHKSLELSRINNSKIYWVERDVLDVVTSMKNVSFGRKAWDIKDDFKKEFIDDPIWKRISDGEFVYHGDLDANDRFIRFYLFIIRLKQYFFDKYIYKVAEKVITEDRSYFDISKSESAKKPLNDIQKGVVEEFDKNLRLLKA